MGKEHISGVQATPPSKEGVLDLVLYCFGYTLCPGKSEPLYTLS